MDGNKGKRGAGGTPGGLLEFFIGLLLIVAGGYLFISRVTVVNYGFSFSFGGFQMNSFGLSLIPLLIGISILFFNGRNLIGWFLTIAGALIIFLGIISNLNFYFQPTSLFNTLIMLGMIAAGLGLVARALRDHSA
ncbi:MAG: hypothetical protein U0694_12885 [Anaerolineae bacterium]